MSNSIPKITKTSQKYLCLCQSISPILHIAKWVGILPIKPSANKFNHLNIGCNFEISKCWLGMSIILQLLLCVYISSTTVMRLHVGSPDVSENFEWHLMTIGYMMLEADSLVSLVAGGFYAPRIAIILQRISRLDGPLNEMRKISRRLNKIFILLSILYAALLCSFFYTAWTRRYNFEYIALSNIIESSVGVIIRGISTIFSQVQCAIVTMMCLLISSKYQHLADSVKSTLEHACFYPSETENKNTKKIKSATIKWMSPENISSNIMHLEHISNQHQEAIYCLSEINHCFGLQLLVTFTANLFIAVYYLYRCITASDENYVTNEQQRIHCSLSLIFLFVKLLLYMHVGQKVRYTAKEPAREMQRGKLLSLPLSFQQQIQCIILQWMSVDPSYLSAFNVINVGPWLLAPIVGNAITYLLVAIQFNLNMKNNITITDL